MKQVIRKLTFLFIVLISVKISAQVDTTEWYPLHVGDKWEYYSRDFGYSQVEVTGDTIMPNGKTYFVFSGTAEAWCFQRVEDNIVYIYSLATNNEHVKYNFTVPDRTIWEVFDDYYWAIISTRIDSQNLLGQPLYYKTFVGNVYIDTTVIPPDTIWGFVDIPVDCITKGFGVSSYYYPIDKLVGAIINGVSYGSLVLVKEDTNLASNLKLYQNYPNPFNPTTTIKYSIPKESHVVIKVFNALGKEVKTLFEGFKNRGKYSVQFNGANLASGIYFVHLVSGSNRQIIKTILIK